MELRKNSKPGRQTELTAIIKGSCASRLPMVCGREVLQLGDSSPNGGVK
jgi:hypothetical protein